MAVEILTRRIEETAKLHAMALIRSNAPFIFTTVYGPQAAISNAAIGDAIRRAQADPSSAIPARFSSHDLRRTFRTGLARLDVAETVCKKILGHRPKRSDITAAVYDQWTYLPEMYAALLKWKQHLLSIVGMQP
jgi:integrase